MKVSIITPSYNQGCYLKRNIDSVASQTYKNYEHLIYDAESTDISLEILRSYATENPKVKLNVGKDGGQCQAINKGFSDATGDILCWLNSDDSYFDEAVLEKVVDAFKNSDADVIYGCGVYIDELGQKLKDVYVNKNVRSPKDFTASLGIFQPALFMTRAVFERVGGLNIGYQLTLDYEYWVRIIQSGFEFEFIPEYFAKATLHDESKTCGSRTPQLLETWYLLKRQYGYVHSKWFQRFYEHVALDNDWTSSRKKTADAATSRNVDWLNNTTSINQLNVDYVSMAELNKQRLQFEPDKVNIEKLIVTSFDESYFLQGLNLIASLNVHAHNNFDLIVVYSLGLTGKQIAYLNMLEGVICINYPEAEPWVGYYSPKSYMYKCLAIYDVKQYLTCSEGLVLWMDSGVCANKSLTDTWSVIKNDGVLLINHDDRSATLTNINFTHPTQNIALKLSSIELLSEHVCSCVLGYRLNSLGEQLVSEVYEKSLDKAINAHSKHPVQKWSPKRPKDNGGYSYYFGQPDINIEDILCVEYPFYGHRQDQSLYSNFATKLNLRIQSAKKWCPATDYTSKVSFENWKSGGEFEGIERETEIPSGIQATFFHHRGTVLNTIGLRLSRSNNLSQDIAFVLGNGPSLADMDFTNLDGIATIGMNSAYRYWDEHNWYPTYYCCMDLVVIMSHADEIYRLIKDSRRNGIKLFFLRMCILDKYPDLKDNPIVLFQEDLEKECPLFRVGPVTTGSYSMLFLFYLGFRKIYLCGVDCNYVEQLPEATQGDNTELTISNEVDVNPNYFFDSYQRKGDKFNIPNPNPGLHIRAWKHAADILEEYKHKLGHYEIINTNQSSKVNLFKNMAVREVMRELSNSFASLFQSVDSYFPKTLADGGMRIYEHIAHMSYKSTHKIHRQHLAKKSINTVLHKPNSNGEYYCKLIEPIKLSSSDEIAAYCRISLSQESNPQKLTLQLLGMSNWKGHPIVHFTFESDGTISTSNAGFSYCIRISEHVYTVYITAQCKNESSFLGVSLKLDEKCISNVISNCSLGLRIHTKAIPDAIENTPSNLIVVTEIADRNTYRNLPFDRAIQFMKKRKYADAKRLALEMQVMEKRQYWADLIKLCDEKIA